MDAIPQPTLHRTTCNLCEAMCGLEVRVAEGKAVSIRGDAADPLSRGHICPKAVALKDLNEDPDRLRAPVERTADGWKQIGWDEAFEKAANGLKGLQARGGVDAVAVYFGNPCVHDHGTTLSLGSLMKALGTRNRYSATSVDQLPHQLATYLMLGHQFFVPVPDVDRTQFMLMLGANPLVSNGSLMTAPDIARRFKELQKRGGRLVVVDPRRTRTAKVADDHLFIRPGSDVYFLLALTREVLRLRKGPLALPVKGLEALREAVEPWTAQRAEPLTGVAAERIERLAQELLGAPSAACYGRVGVSTQAFGALCQWLLLALNVLTGNLDREGGMMFPSPAFSLAQPQRRGSFERYRSRVRSLPEFGGELPVATLAEEILTPGEGQVRGLVTVAGNPVLSTPGGRRLDEALSTLDYYVAIDIFRNETTRHAHLILPPTSGLETERYDLIFHHFAVRNTVKYSPAVLSPAPGSKSSWEVITGLSGALSGHTQAGPTPEQMLGMALKAGPYRIDLRELAADHPSGLDLGPLKSGQLPDGLFTEDKLIDLAPEPYLRDMTRLGDEQPDASLLLIGRRSLRSNNSWMHNCERLVKGRNRCTLQMHPADAAERGLQDGDAVTVKSRAGTVEFPVEITEEVMPGVVCAPHGWGHSRDGVALQVAQQRPGASVNDITDPEQVDKLCGNAVLNGVAVRVGRLRQKTLSPAHDS